MGNVYTSSSAKINQFPKDAFLVSLEEYNPYPVNLIVQDLIPSQFLAYLHKTHQISDTKYKQLYMKSLGARGVHPSGIAALLSELSSVHNMVIVISNDTVYNGSTRQIIASIIAQAIPIKEFEEE